MDYELDSDLEDMIEVDVNTGEIQPYMFEPVKTSASASVRSDIDQSDEENEYVVGENLDVQQWCICKNCSNMDTAVECRCCKKTNIIDGMVDSEELSCITEHEGFISNCLNIHVLKVSYYDYVIDSGPLEEDQLIHEFYRYLAYRRFTRWAYGLLGRRQRKVIPSCVVTTIRQRFPSEDYAGFKYPV